ncbi:MAG: hypothetical protein J6S67_24345 [Methanobrevibacter sp.]|nr:hypothetical protein [Methanobrevibacter sp.]
MEEKLKETTQKSIEKILNEGLTTANLEHLYKLTKINKMAKEEENMNYGNYGDYGRRPGYDSYGNYGEGYGRRGYDAKYRGYGHLDKMGEEYGRYQDYRSRYGANEDTKRSLEYMLKAMEDFARMLKEDAQSPEEVQMIKQTAQRIAQM